ncbi:MAG TPA: permease-like cell division protein FtsX [Longimicrobium sp.]|nr:permease-like cell division protein FtsX [Longimicrobium sp.]
MPYALREAFAAFRRTPLLAMLSVVAIAFSLFIVGLFGLTAYNISQAVSRVEEKVEVVGYLRDDATPAQLQLAQDEIRRLPEVQELRYVDKTEALATAMAEMDEFRDVFTDLDSNPLPASIEVSLRTGQSNPEAVGRVAKRLGAYAFVEEVDYGDGWVEKIYTIRRLFGAAATAIGGAFALVAAIIIATAIRIAVFARREEISIMRLVGATDGFVQLPFVLEGVITGLLGGLAAAGLTYLAFGVLNRYLFQLNFLPTEWIVGMVAAGTVFGFLSSMVAVRRHLEEV